jgi:hypothetical protein
MSNEAAEKNFCIFSKYNFDLGRALDPQNKSPLGYGSEFRSTGLLKQVFGCHPIWSRFQSLLISGSDWPMKELSTELRKADVQDALNFGNYKGATMNPPL